MKTIQCLMVSVCTLLLVSSPLKAQQQLKIGAQAPLLTHEVQDVSGRSLTLQGVAEQNGLLVIFSCNTCPWVIRWQDRFPVVAELAEENSIGMILLNPNEAYRDRGDSMDDMIRHARKAGYDFPYALDRNHIIADAFGAMRTPHVYLFNGDMELVYTGAIDDKPGNAAAVENFYLKKAIEQMISGENINTPTTKSLGCSIKRTG